MGLGIDIKNRFDSNVIIDIKKEATKLGEEVITELYKLDTSEKYTENEVNMIVAVQELRIEDLISDVIKRKTKVRVEKRKEANRKKKKRRKK